MIAALYRSKATGLAKGCTSHTATPAIVWETDHVPDRIPAARYVT